MPAEDHGRHKGAVEFGGRQPDDQGVTKTILVVLRRIPGARKSFLGMGA